MLININLKNQLNHQLNIATLKNFAYHEIFQEMVFFLTNLSQDNFLYYHKFLYNDTVCAPIEMK